MMLPSSNTIAEPQIARMLPPGVSLHTTRLRLAANGREALGMLERLEEGTQLMAERRRRPAHLPLHCREHALHPRFPARITRRVAANYRYSADDHHRRPSSRRSRARRAQYRADDAVRPGDQRSRGALSRASRNQRAARNAASASTAASRWPRSNRSSGSTKRSRCAIPRPRPTSIQLHHDPFGRT